MQQFCSDEIGGVKYGDLHGGYLVSLNILKEKDERSKIISRDRREKTRVIASERFSHGSYEKILFAVIAEIDAQGDFTYYIVYKAIMKYRSHLYFTFLSKLSCSSLGSWQNIDPLPVRFFSFD